jgi:hypothetical protein
MQRKYRLVLIDGSRRPEEIHRSLKATNNKFLSPMIIKKFSLFHNAYKSKTDLNAANVHY